MSQNASKAKMVLNGFGIELSSASARRSGSALSGTDMLVSICFNPELNETIAESVRLQKCARKFLWKRAMQTRWPQKWRVGIPWIFDVW